MKTDIDFTVYCSCPGFEKIAAVYKVAADWHCGSTTELKTFGFANDDCIEEVWKQANERASKIRLSFDEELSEIRVYKLQFEKSDADLERCLEIERRFRSDPNLKDNSPDTSG